MIAPNGRATFEWNTCPAAQAGTNPPCPCGGRCMYGGNPPPAPDPGALAALVEDLGTALAIGALGSQLGMPDGQRLVSDVASFVDSSPILQRAYATTETGELLGLVEGIGRGASRAFGAVERRAASVLDFIEKHSGGLATVAVIGGGLALGSQYLSADERTKATEIAGRHALVADAIAEVPADKRAAALAQLSGVLGPSSGGGGISLWTWLGLGALALVGVWAWRRFA